MAIAAWAGHFNKRRLVCLQITYWYRRRRVGVAIGGEIRPYQRWEGTGPGECHSPPSCSYWWQYNLLSQPLVIVWQSRSTQPPLMMMVYQLPWWRSQSSSGYGGRFIFLDFSITKIAKKALMSSLHACRSIEVGMKGPNPKQPSLGHRRQYCKWGSVLFHWKLPRNHLLTCRILFITMW
jgi:hypothetical protein